MASSRIDLRVDGKDNTKSAFDSVSKGISKIGTEANKAGATIGTGITKGAQTASNAVGRLKAAAEGTFGMIKAGADAAGRSLGGMGSAISSLIGGFGALQAVQMAWTGASQREFNEMYLRTKMAGGAADKYLNTIADIVSQVPGDDTWMNALLTGALARETTMQADMLQRLGTVASKYVIAAQQTGAAILPVNAERELSSYIKTGNTGLMIRDGLLKNHVQELQKAKTPTERILALEKAMTKEGFMQMDTAALTSSKWEEIKGRIQLAATNIGSKLLPFVEKILDGFTWLDEHTSGWASALGFAAATIAAIGVAVAPIVTATVAAAKAMWSYAAAARAAATANASNKGPGVGGTAGKTGGLLNNLLIGAGAFTVVGVAIWSAIEQGYAHAAVDKQIFNPERHEGTIGQAMVDAVESQKPRVQAALSNVYDTGAVKSKLTEFRDWLRVSVTDEAIVAGARGIWNGVAGAAQSAFGTIMRSWNLLKSTISKGISTAINIGTGAIDWARQKYNDLKNWIMGNPIVQRIVTIASSGASAVSNVVSTVSGAASSAWAWLTGARGPGDVKYMDYAGYTGRNPWQSDGTLAGNCVDMSVGLVQRYGGELVNGTWNGGLHTWWRAPDGREYDPSRKALNNTWAPPNSRGPGDGGVTYVFNAPVYGYDDFARKVEQVNNRIVSGVY